VLRAQGRFADSVRPLQELEPLIQKEYVRESMALSERAVALAELGQFAESARLVGLAIERSQGVPTRYLFAQGVVYLMQGDPAGARAVAAAIRSQELPQDSPQDAVVVREAATRAAAYLDGMADLRSGNASKASATLARVLELPGYQYTIYRLGLAQSLFSQGKLAEALETTRAAALERDAGDIRLDLELDRSRALLLEAEILAALEQQPAAAARAREFLRRWSNSEPSHPDRVRAEQLAEITRPRTAADRPY
jgi:tetratricopeptide (TPR) repeat protein